MKKLFLLILLLFLLNGCYIVQSATYVPLNYGYYNGCGYGYGYNRSYRGYGYYGYYPYCR